VKDPAFDLLALSASPSLLLVLSLLPASTFKL